MTLRHPTLTLAAAVLGLATLAAAHGPPDAVGWTTIANDRRVLREGLEQTAHARMPDARLTERARALLREVPLIDGHKRSPLGDAEARFATTSRGSTPARAARSADRHRAPGAGGSAHSSGRSTCRRTWSGPGAVTMSVEQIDFVHQLVRRYPDVFEWAGTADDVERIFRAGRIASMARHRGRHSIDSSLATLAPMYRLGARAT